MKKILLFILILICTDIASAQVIFHEDFDGVGGPTAGGAGTYTFPPGWRLRNVDNRTPAANVAYVNEAWERREDFSFNVVDSCAFSTSWYSPAGAADDWMWTPLIANLPESCVLSWKGVAYDGSFRDGYEVRIMTTEKAPMGPTGGTGMIGNQDTASSIVFSTTAENNSWTDHSVSLDTFANKSIYIGFRNNSNDKFLLLIDDIKVEQVMQYNASLNSHKALTEYTLVPEKQAHAIPFEANIQNMGLDTLFHLQLNVEVRNASNQLVYSDTSVADTLNPGVATTLTVPSFTPDTAGTYTVKFFTTMLEADEQTSNDTLYSSFVISDSVYARDNGVVVGQLGIGTGGGYLGQDFDILNDDYLNSVSIHYTRGYAGEKFAAVIWKIEGGMPSSIVASTDTLTYPDDSARTYRLPIYGGGAILLDSGLYAVTAIEFDSTVAVAQTSGIFTLGTTWVDWPTNPVAGWGHNESYGSQFQKSYYIRANMGCVLKGRVDSMKNVSCHGASDGSIYISNTGNRGPVTYQWTPNVSDSSSAVNLPGGIYTVVMTDSTQCSTTHVISIQEPDTINTQTTVAGTTITASATGMSYQWINCNGNTPIAGAVLRSYTPTQSGSYAVVLSNHNCMDTSACVNITIVGMNNKQAGGFDVYPNPNDGRFTVKSAEVDGTYNVYNGLGQLVKTFTLNTENNYTITIDDIPQGVYMISGQAGEKQVSQKLIINK